ncbi:MAG: cytochrome c551 peroxidase [Candidatus Binatia bacterium]|nr:MAG: cytochrome c551 peroxidase [Candidatus Binatia bacterium]
MGFKAATKRSLATVLGAFALYLPKGVLEPLIPPDNPLTAEKVALGKKLYFDKRLSADGTVSCATCHDPLHGFADGKAVAVGIRGQAGARNSPTVLYTGFSEVQFWDGRAPTLEEQAKQPLINPVEMGQPSHDAVVKAVASQPEYPPLFQQAFGSPQITIDRIVQAIATFERTLAPFSSPFDRFLAGEKTALSDAAKRGFQLFLGKARCVTCHEFNASFPFFTDNKFHNIGVAMKGNFEALAREAQAIQAKGNKEAESALAHKPGVEALGRWIVTREPKDIGAFKTSGLRNVALTAPYMHDGSLKTLEEVMDFYNRGGEPNPNLDGGMRPLNLTKEEIADIIEFMKSLTDESGGKNFDWEELKELSRKTRAGELVAAPAP